MPSLKKGSFSLNFGIVRLSADLAEDDRQCAWELYTELSTRVAVTGKSKDNECADFSGELYIESLESLYKFFQESRSIMRRFPVGKIGGNQQKHLGVLINNMLEDVVRPFLEKWQITFRHWWENASNPRTPPLQRQEEFPDLKEFLEDWASVRWLLRGVMKELITVYDLVDVGAKQLLTNA